MSIFALLAAIVWLLAAFGVHLASIDMLLLGLGLLALHFAIGYVVPIGGLHRRTD